MNEKINILDVNIDNVTFEQALNKAKQFLSSYESDSVTHICVTPNPEIIMLANKDEKLKEILNGADLCTADGIGVVYASKIMKTPLPERVAGFDIACELLEYCASKDIGVFLFGSKPEMAEKAKEKLEEKYKGIKICGVHHGYFKEDESQEIVDKINASGAKLLFVCLGAPKQEKWIDSYKDKLNVSLCMGLGGVIDVLAGEVKRAPDIFIKLNLEWFYRLMKQPSRIGRYMELPKFISKVLKER